MTPKEISDRLNDKFSRIIVASFPVDNHPRIHLDAAHWRKIAGYIKNDSDINMDYLMCISGVDYVADDKLACVYDFRSMTYNHEFAFKVFTTDRNSPEIDSISDLWPAANWHEREIYDLFGINFPGHPDMRRILLPEDWVGHPLRKDYEFPREYHGIPMSYELDWQQKPTYPK